MYKGINIFISILLLLPIYSGMAGMTIAGTQGVAHFQKDCDMDPCFPHFPECSVCLSTCSMQPYLNKEIEKHLPIQNISYILVSVDIFSDQEFVKPIFHPPTALF